MVEVHQHITRLRGGLESRALRIYEAHLRQRDNL
jgi:hypothetical protein